MRGGPISSDGRRKEREKRKGTLKSVELVRESIWANLFETHDTEREEHSIGAIQNK
jgi:hypothetical protein